MSNFYIISIILLLHHLIEIVQEVGHRVMFLMAVLPAYCISQITSLINACLDSITLQPYRVKGTVVCTHKF